MQIPLYLGAEHDCSYLSGQNARMAVVSPDTGVNSILYGILLANGFRRSGDMVYRPQCATCSACVPVRIPVAEFRPNRSQRRVERFNADLDVTVRSATFDEEHYRLFVRYLEARHADGDMAQGSREDFMRFLGNGGWLDTRFCEFRDAAETLLAVSVVDMTPDALSAVYTFYDPACEQRSPGSFAILWQIAEARRRGLDWVYLGFWIAECRKMAYKSAFKPHQCFTRKGWETTGA